MGSIHWYIKLATEKAFQAATHRGVGLQAYCRVMLVFLLNRD